MSFREKGNPLKYQTRGKSWLVTENGYPQPLLINKSLPLLCEYYESRQNRKIEHLQGCKAHNISKKTLRCRLKDLSQGKGIKAAKQGRRPSFEEEEESIVVNRCLEFVRDGTLLSREVLRVVIKLFCSGLHSARRDRLPFGENKPGHIYLNNLLRRHPEVTLKRRAALATAMYPESLSRH